MEERLVGIFSRMNAGGPATTPRPSISVPGDEDEFQMYTRTKLLSKAPCRLWHRMTKSCPSRQIDF